MLLGSRAGLLTPVNDGVAFDLGGLLHSAVAGFASLSGRHDLVLVAALLLPLAVGDPSSFEIIVGQLLENAVKYSPAGGEVRVTSASDGDRVVMTVADRGSGISYYERALIFDRFHQVSDALTGKPPGTGLGLTICRMMLRQLGGEIWAGAAPGGGALLTVRLQRSAVAVTDAPRQPQPAAASGS